MKFENTEVFNFEGAFRGMRNPYDSWDKADSSFGTFSYEPNDDGWEIAEKYYGSSSWRNSDDPEEIKEAENEIDEIQQWLIDEGIHWDKDQEHGTWTYIGPKDLSLAQRLINGGPVHSKFLRQIIVSVDITAPLYWWKEFDTYKVGTVANSCSTMHKLAAYPITLDCFEIEDYEPDLIIDEGVDDHGDTPTDYKYPLTAFIEPETDNFYFEETLIGFLEQLRRKYNETKDKKYWKELVRWLPNGWLQKRTVTLNYEILRNIYKWRAKHRLTEWHAFCDWIKTLPYAEDLITYKIDPE